jgi:hypothetical protein
VPCALLATPPVPQQHNSSTQSQRNQQQCHHQPEQMTGCSSSRGSSSGGSWNVSHWQHHSQQQVTPQLFPSPTPAAAAHAWQSQASFFGAATPRAVLSRQQQQRLMSSMPDFHSTTILCVRKGPEVRLLPPPLPTPHRRCTLKCHICCNLAVSELLSNLQAAVVVLKHRVHLRTAACASSVLWQAVVGC